ncbi:MAG: ABC-2 transporter permease [Coprobacillus cateniformis]|uniref:ABC-2 transporter permease n=1 Tax=Longibaculum muris TaxID=1796628 RepID=UPI0029FF3852|nr:ABC-2 transporter permease [Coprobacillus cateniformis]
MKGLLIKDFQLLKNQKSFFVVFIAMAVIFLVTDMMSQDFLVSYVSFLSIIMMISSMTYDEFNNGLSYLMTLPTTRKKYVQEKYVFGFILLFIAWISAFLATTGFYLGKGELISLSDWLLSCFMILLCAVIMIQCVLPLQLKFGQNKGNIAMALIVGVVFAVGFIVMSIVKLFDIDLTFLMRMISQIDLFQIILMMIGVVIIVGFISYRISLKIMYKKEL